MTGIDHGTYINRLKERVRQKPDSALFLSLAEELRKQDRADEAIALLVEGIKKNPSFVEARLTLGRWYRGAAMLAEARKELSAAAELSPESLFVHRELAETYRQLGDAALAAEEFRKVLSLDPFDSEAASFLESAGPSAAPRNVVATESAAAPVESGAEGPQGGSAAAPGRAVETVELRELRRLQPWAALLQQAEELIAAEEYGRAIELYNTLLVTNPHHSPTLQKKGELASLMRLNGADKRAARARLEKLLRLIKERCSQQRDREKEAALRRLEGLRESIASRFAHLP